METILSLMFPKLSRIIAWNSQSPCCRPLFLNGKDKDLSMILNIHITQNNFLNCIGQVDQSIVLPLAAVDFLN